MKIFMLLKKNDEGIELICISEEIKKISKKACEHNTKGNVLILEVWRNGERRHYFEGSCVFEEIVRETNGL